MLTPSEALQYLLSEARPVTETNTVSLEHSLGRILAQDLVSSLNLPATDLSAMDGYAVRAAETREGATLPVSQRIPAGVAGDVPLTPNTAARIFTGAPLPPGADSVLMQEDCIAGDGTVTFQRTARMGENVRKTGSEVAQGAAVLTRGTRLTSAHIGLAASVGAATLPCLRPLRIALFSTGSELVPPGQPLQRGQIYNSNHYQLLALLHSLGCEINDLGTIPDRLDATRDALRRAAQGHDLILTSGGVSVGEEDHIKPAVEAEGTLHLWKIAIKPGKPLAYGRIGQAAFIGLPGNPVSGFVTFLLFVRPFILASMGATHVAPAACRLPAAFDWGKAQTRTEYLRARLDERDHVALHPHQGSAALASIAWADGLAVLPAHTTLRVGDPIEYLPFAGLLG